MTSSAWCQTRIEPDGLVEWLAKRGNDVTALQVPVAVAALHPRSCAFELRLGAERLRCTFTDEAVYEHLAITTKWSTLPTLSLLEEVRRSVWGLESLVLQLHPRGFDYTAIEPSWAHLWRPMWPFEKYERKAIEHAVCVLGKRPHFKHVRDSQAKRSRG